MAPLLKLREAARLISVSPGRLYRVIADGRLTAASGGGPGKPTLISMEALQTFCRSEGLRVPDAAEMIERSERLERAERSEHAERSMSPAEEALARQALETMAGQYLAQVRRGRVTTSRHFSGMSLTTWSTVWWNVWSSRWWNVSRNVLNVQNVRNVLGQCPACHPHHPRRQGSSPRPRCCNVSEPCRPKASLYRRSPIASITKGCQRSAAKDGGGKAPLGNYWHQQTNTGQHHNRGSTHTERPKPNTDTGGEFTKPPFFHRGQPHKIMGSERW
jgi:hypothetical protein